MLGIPALETNAPIAVSEYMPKERRALQDIDVNRNHHLSSNISSKNGRNTGKTSIPSGFQVFADGETSSFPKKANVKIPVKSSALDAKQVVGGKKPFQISNGVSSKDLTGGIINSVANRTVATTGAQVDNINRLEKQLASMQIEKMPNQTQDQVGAAVTHDIEIIEKALSTVNTYYKEIDVVDRSAERYEQNISATSNNLGQEQQQKSSDTGAIRKVASNANNSAYTIIDDALPTFQLNAMAEEWSITPGSTTMGTLYDDGTASDSTQSGSGVPQPVTFWYMTLDVEPNHRNQGTDATRAYCHNFPTSTHPIGRRIVGRKYTPFEKVSLPTQRDIIEQLDDRSEEFARFQRSKETRRKKAIEAMLIEQKRLKRMTGLPENVPTGMKNQMQPTATTCTNYATERSGFHGFERAKNTTYDQAAIPPLSSVARSAAKPSVCIMKYPTPPNVLIRYEPRDLMKMNYTPNNTTGKRAKKIQEKLKK